MTDRKFLIADDSPVIVATLQRVLVRLGVPISSIRVVSDGSAALDVFHEFKPSVVLVDINMPGMDGEQAARAMMTEDPDVRIVVVTGLERGDKRVAQLISQGAFEVIHKPIRGEEIERVLRLLDSEEMGSGRIR